MKRRIMENHLVAAAAADFIRHSQIKGLAADTIKAYTGYLNTFIEWFGKDGLLDDIDEVVIVMLSPQQ